MINIGTSAPGVEIRWIVRAVLATTSSIRATSVPSVPSTTIATVHCGWMY